MLPSNQPSLHLTLQQLKEIVASTQGVNHESAKLVDSIEQLVAEIERKSNNNATGTLAATIVQPLVTVQP